MPSCSQWPRLSLTIPDDARDKEIRIVKRRAERMHKGIPQFAPFMYGAGRFGRRMARNSAGKGELTEQSFHPVFILTDLRVQLAVSPLQPGIGHQRGTAVTGTANIEHIEVALADHAVQMDIGEVQSGRCSPMAEEFWVLRV